MARKPVAKDESGELEGLDLTTLRYQGTGFQFKMGELLGISTVIPTVDLVQLNVDEVLRRDDYELDADKPGNRIISPGHVQKIKTGLKKHAKKLLLGSFILAIDPEGVKVDEVATRVDSDADVTVVKFGIRSGHELFILDAQHRNNALRDLWQETLDAVRAGDLSAEEVARLLRQSSVPVLIVLEEDKNEISRMFVTLASTKPISPSLIAVMDRESLSNRLGLEVARRSQLLGRSERLAYQTSTATGDHLYAAAAVRGASAGVFIGFRDRTPEMREENLIKALENTGDELDLAFEAAADEVAGLLDYAYERMPGWKELGTEELSPREFRAQYVHGAAGGLYVIAGVICASRLAGVDPRSVIDALASDVEWRKAAIEPRATGGGQTDGERPRHPDFDGTLVLVEPEVDDDGRVTGWRTRTGGGNRTAYEKAARQLLDSLVENYPEFKELTSPTVLGELGLAPRPGEKRGRPRTAAVPA